MNFVAIVALLLVADAVEAENTYAAYVPKYIRPGEPYSIDVEILEYDGTIDVEAKLKSDDHNSVATAKISKDNPTANLMFDTIPYGYEGSTNFKVEITGVDNNKMTNEKPHLVFYNETINIQYQKKFLSIFIQTDKAIYQPGHIIKFRAAVIKSDLLPYEGTASFRLQDPKGNTILKESDAVLNMGVVGSQFKLGRYSILGDWKITYEVHGYEESQTVSVEEYKLPKFSVGLKTDQKFLHPGSTKLTGELSATYTFGQPVRGSAVVEFTIGTWWSWRIDPQPKMIITFPEFDGSEPFEIEAAKIESTLNWNPKGWSQPLKIVANVTDKNTGETFQETANVDLHQVKMKVETLAKPEHIKPGLPYIAYLKISQQDGSPLDADDLEDLEMNVEVRYNYQSDFMLPWDEQKKPKVENVPVVVGPGGIIVFKTTASADNFNNVNFNVKIPSYPNVNQHWVSWSAERFKSPSNTFLQASTDDTSLDVGDTAELTVCTTETSEAYRIQLLARGKVVKSKLYTPASYMTTDTYSSFKYSFPVEMEYSPSVYAVVSFVRDDGEFIADTVKINVQAALANKVTLTADPNLTDAGRPVSITIKAEAGSFVGLRAIDQSVLLLKSGNDITQDKIFQDLEQYGPSGGSGGIFPRWGGWWWPWSVGGADVSEVFENSGIIVLSDGIVYKDPPKYHSIMMMQADHRGMLMSAPLEAFGMISAGGAKVRKYFPETWIWTNSSIGDDGSVTLNYNTPDTITTWELSSFAVSDTKGLGVTKENTKITVFRNFFISLDLPPSVVRGEVLKMKTTVFNYFDQDLEATLSLTDNDWYDILPVLRMTGPPGVRTITIPKKDSVTVVFPIEFKKAGNARIEIRAQSALAGDAVERTLLVKPEGIPKIVSHSNIFDRQDENEPPTVIPFDVDIPDDAVEGSVYVKFSVSGNVMGSALSNLGSLLKMPSGCGEQTMLSFAPDVYVSLYLKEVGELTGEIKQKSEEHIREGYQNELRYQRDDGSFSAFGSSDRSGSTWLTAFVAKCFIAANELNPDLIEESKITQAVNFILKQQNKDGTFNEPGRVIHKDMQGGVNSAETTAAYMLIALTEGGSYKKNEDVEMAVQKAKTYLEGKIDSIDDIYTLSIVGYALALVDSDEAMNVLNMIDEKATMEANIKYWKKDVKGAAKCTERVDYCPFDDKSSSSIEITAYVLLTYIKMGKTNEVMPIVRWLVQQRGAFGGYSSTQDTVMAIQALSTIAGFFSDRELDLDISVTHSGKEDYKADFELNDENAIVLQMTDLPAMDGTVSVTGSGVGFGDVQVTVGYNLPVSPETDEPFTVEVKVRKIVDRVTVEVCSKINEDRINEVIDGTGMFVVTFQLPSGYTIDDKRATKDNPQAKLIELVGEEVTGYFDELPKGKTICMSLELIKYAEVEKVKPKIVKVFDYYEPGTGAQRSLMMPPDEDDKCPCCTDDIKVPCCVHTCPRTEPPDVTIIDGEQTPCGTETYMYPCSDFADGLFYDSTSHIVQMIAKYPDKKACSAPEGAGDSRASPGLPASRLDGDEQFLECADCSDCSAMLRSMDGWTLSLAVYPTELKRLKLYTIFSMSAEGRDTPYVIFEKRPRLNQYWLKVAGSEFELTVRGIFIGAIPVNQWSLITVRVENNVGSVFVNGVSKGKPVRKKSKQADAHNGNGDITIKIGQSHVGERKGNFKGLVSTLDLWKSALTDEEILAHYNYWQSALTQSNPILDTAQVHHCVPESIRKCFNKAYPAMELKSPAGELRTDCDEINGTPPPRPPPLILMGGHQDEEITAL